MIIIKDLHALDLQIIREDHLLLCEIAVIGIGDHGADLIAFLCLFDLGALIRRDLPHGL